MSARALPRSHRRPAPRPIAHRSGTISETLQYASVFLGGAHVFFAGCWFAANQHTLGVGSIVLGLIIPGLILTLS